MEFGKSATVAPLSRRRTMLMLACSALAWPARAAEGDAPLRIVIAFPPGGTSTALIKPLEPLLQPLLGVAIEREYKPGAGGNVAALHVVQSKPDGKTLLVGHAGPLAINHHILVQSSFDPRTDLAPVAMLVEFPIVVGIASRYGVSTVADLLALARQKRLVVGSSGNGSIQHLAAELFCRETGIETVHIPFAGGGPLQQAFERGAVDLMLETGSNVVKHLRQGTLTAVAVLSRQRLAIVPEVPTLAEAGFAPLDVAAWFGLLAPGKTPPETIERLAKATLEALASPAVRAAYEAIGGLPKPLGPQAFARHIAAENRRWADLIRDAGLSVRGAGSTGTIGTPQ